MPDITTPIGIDVCCFNVQNNAVDLPVLRAPKKITTLSSLNLVISNLRNSN